MFQYYRVLQSLRKAVRSTTVYYKACTKSFPVLLCTTKLAQSTSQYYCVLQSLHKQRRRFCSFPRRHGDGNFCAAKQTKFYSFPHRHGDATGQVELEVLQLPPKTRRHQRTRRDTGFAASPIDTATPEPGFAAFPIDTATPQDKQKRRFCSFPIDTATPERGFAASPIDTATPEDKQKRRFCTDTATRFCSFPHTHGDARGQAETEVLHGFAASLIDTATSERGFAPSPIETATPEEKQRLRFCSFPHRHEINDAKNDAKTTRKTTRKPRKKRRNDQLEANKGPAPRPLDYKREPFASHSGKIHDIGKQIDLIYIYIFIYIYICVYA